MMKIANIYISLGGNTESLGLFIMNQFKQRGHSVSSVNIQFNETELDLNDYDLLLLGTYTWGEGKTPTKMRQFLKKTFVESDYPKNLPIAVYGTGETQWTYYCRAVDEINYHSKKYTDRVIDTLKIEQLYKNQQEDKVLDFVNNILSEMNK